MAANDAQGYGHMIVVQSGVHVVCFAPFCLDRIVIPIMLLLSCFAAVFFRYEEKIHVLRSIAK